MFSSGYFGRQFKPFEVELMNGQKLNSISFKRVLSFKILSEGLTMNDFPIPLKTI